MTLVRHELKQGWKSLLVWTLAIGSFIIICLFMYPEMKSQMSSISSIFSSMGMFSSAFGLDTLDFGSLKGFYGIECGNILGIGGALFADSLIVGEVAQLDEVVAQAAGADGVRDGGVDFAGKADFKAPAEVRVGRAAFCQGVPEVQGVAVGGK